MLSEPAFSLTSITELLSYVCRLTYRVKWAYQVYPIDLAEIIGYRSESRTVDDPKSRGLMVRSYVSGHHASGSLSGSFRLRSLTPSTNLRRMEDSTSGADVELQTAQVLN